MLVIVFIKIVLSEGEHFGNICCFTSLQLYPWKTPYNSTAIPFVDNIFWCTEMTKHMI